MTEARGPVTVEDREAAIRRLERTGRSREDLCGAAIRNGDWDHTEDVQAFARHRLAGVAAGREEAAKVAERFDPRGIMSELTYNQCCAHGEDIAAAIRQRGE